MAYSEVEICNIAIARCGSDSTIASLGEQSKEGRLCQRFYALARDLVLEKVVWPGFVRIVALAPLSDDEALLPDWGYEYALPANAANVGAVIPSGEIGAVSASLSDCCGPWLPGRFGRYAFRKALSSDGTRQAILSNVEDAYAVYSVKVTDTTMFSTMMVDAIADRLAMEIAMPLTADPRWARLAADRFQLSFPDAAMREFEQERHAPDADPPSIRARR